MMFWKRIWKRKKARKEIVEMGEQLRESRCYNRREIRRLLKAASVDELTADLLLIGSVAKMRGLEDRLMGNISHLLETGQLIPGVKEPSVNTINPDDPAFG